MCKETELRRRRHPSARIATGRGKLPMSYVSTGNQSARSYLGREEKTCRFRTRQIPGATGIESATPPPKTAAALCVGNFFHTTSASAPIAMAPIAWPSLRSTVPLGDERHRYFQYRSTNFRCCDCYFGTYIAGPMQK